MAVSLCIGPQARVVIQAPINRDSNKAIVDQIPTLLIIVGAIVLGFKESAILPAPRALKNELKTN
jgi:hypothetical protein